MSTPNATQNDGVRECPECVAVTERQHLVATTDGNLVCPGCGEILVSYAEDFDGEHGLKLPVNASNEIVIHLPRNDQAQVPRCANGRENPNATWKPISAESAADRAYVCRRCDPAHIIDHAKNEKHHYATIGAEDFGFDDLAEANTATPRGDRS